MAAETPGATKQAAGAGSIVVRPVTGRAAMKAFVTFPWRIYADDPCWVPPLISQQLDRLDPKKNPLFKTTRMQLFMAERAGEPVGTIAASINDRRNEYLSVADGYFGFFQSIDDVDVARALTDAAGAWLRERGMTVMRGPIDLDEAEELGLVIEGFDERQVVMLAHTPRYYVRLLEEAGFAKWYDTSAFRLTRDDIGGRMENLPRKLFVAAERVRTRHHVTVRPVDMKAWDREIGFLFEMFNETIAQVNASFVPMEEDMLRYLAGQMKQLLDPDLAMLAEVLDETHAGGRRPIGFAVALPDIYQVLRAANGRLLPFGWAKLLYLSRKIDALSFKLLGVVAEYRGRGIEGLLMLDVIQAAWHKGYTTCDMSVIDESNVATRRLLTGLGAYPYRTFRVYQRAL